MALSPSPSLSDAGPGLGLDAPRFEADLAQALARGELRLLFQPVVDVSQGIVAVEALLRWRHSSGRLLEPAEFFPAPDMAAEVFSWVLRSATAAARGWRRRGRGEGIVVSINAPPELAADAGLGLLVADGLAASGLAPHRLCVELPASAVAPARGEFLTAPGREVIAVLRRMGVGVAIDDVDVAPATMRAVAAVPPVVLKLRRGVVASARRTDRDWSVVRSAVALARAHGHEVVAKGIERPEDLDRLVAAGCTRMQGFLLHRPVPADRLEHLLGRAR